MDELLTPADAARILGLTPASVRALADRGRLAIAAVTRGGNRLFRRQAVEALARLRESQRRPVRRAR
jgi:excisionase family DNA binding protein